MNGSREAIPEKGGEILIKIPEEIIDAAKEAMRRFGGHPPMLFVHGTKQKTYQQLPFGETLDERIAIMMAAGGRLAKFGDIGDVEMAIFVSEGWVSPARTPLTRPSQDPNRTEALVISALDAKSNTQTLEVYACIRDKKQVVIDLKRMPLPKGVKAESPLLPAFLNGFRLFKK